VTEKFEFIDAEYAAYRESDDEHVPSIVKMCVWMEVSRSGFYEWRNAPESATVKRRGILALYVRKSFGDSDDTYGYRRVHADLAAWGVPAGPELVRSVMRELGLEPCQPRPWRVSLTEGDGQVHDIPDLVHRDFTADAPGEKMVGDITYIPTWEGWLFLATVIDCHTKAVIGWAVDDNYRTPLIQQAIEMGARNYRLAEGAIFHSDRGSNYTSGQFAMRSGRGLEAHVRQAADLRERALEQPHHLERSLRPGGGLHRVQAGMSRDRRDTLVELRVVLHRARPERVEARVQVEVAPRDAVVVAHDLRLAHLRQGRGRAAQQMAGNQLLERALGHVGLRQDGGSATLSRALVDRDDLLALHRGARPDLRGRPHADTASRVPAWATALPRASASRSICSRVRRSVIATSRPSSSSG